MSTVNFVLRMDTHSMKPILAETIVLGGICRKAFPTRDVHIINGFGTGRLCVNEGRRWN
jgi:hypothetical protein